MTKNIVKLTKQEWLDIVHYLRANVSDSYANELADQICDYVDFEKVA